MWSRRTLVPTKTMTPKNTAFAILPEVVDEYGRLSRRSETPDRKNSSVHAASTRKTRLGPESPEKPVTRAPMAEPPTTNAASRARSRSGVAMALVL